MSVQLSVQQTICILTGSCKTLLALDISLEKTIWTSGVYVHGMFALYSRFSRNSVQKTFGHALAFHVVDSVADVAG